VLGPGDSMVDSEYMVKKGGGDHGHGVVNPDGEGSGHSVHPYRLGRVVGKECSNDRIYEHNDLVRDFMASLKEFFARGGRYRGV